MEYTTDTDEGENFDVSKLPLLVLLMIWLSCPKHLGQIHTMLSVHVVGWDLCQGARV